MLLVRRQTVDRTRAPSGENGRKTNLTQPAFPCFLRMSGMLLVPPGMHPVRGVAKASRHPRPLHVFQKKYGKQGQYD